ncbi:hypothetical protein EVAR_5598_1 [Eumeta japonica]|uniref:ATP-dependent DNA helicase n=1 Tax=Eumeta variegata TaxID=151549 RepID=A0A4C1U1V3_EUMVA|nr:hypothetical protein EVAR_5598_1 [Eumeta japonica]
MPRNENLTVRIHQIQVESRERRLLTSERNVYQLPEKRVMCACRFGGHYRLCHIGAGVNVCRGQRRDGKRHGGWANTASNYGYGNCRKNILEDFYAPQGKKCSLTLGTSVGWHTRRPRKQLITRRNNHIMGSVTVLFCGDFRQTLLDIIQGTRDDEVNACLKCSVLWTRVQKLSLMCNMRAHLDSNSRA